MRLAFRANALNRKRIVSFAIGSVLLVGVNACGGGGGSAPAAPPVPGPSSTSDTRPDPFSFGERVGAELGVTVESSTIRVTGIDSTAPISVSGGEYAINNQAFTSAPGTVSVEADVRVRLTSSSSHSTVSSATLNIGGETGTFSVTTKADSGSSSSSASKTTRIALITSKLPETQGSLTDEVARREFARSKALIERLSYGIHTLELSGIYDLGETQFSRADLVSWSATAGLLSRVVRADGRNPIEVDCDLAVEGPKAQVLLDNMSDQEKALNGISIDRINLGFAQTLSEKQCRDFSVGGILVTRAKLPESIDYTQIDQIVYAPFDEVVHAGGYNIGFAFSGMQRPASMSSSDASRIEFVMSGAVQSSIDKLLDVEAVGMGEPVSSNTYLADAPYLQTQFSRITTHEIIHGLGIGTHDNGIQADTSVSDAAAINSDPIVGASRQDLGYGDWFSIMGQTQYAAGVSPGVKEFLGWLNADRIHMINSGSGSTTYTLSPLSSNDGFVAGKVSVFGDRGFVYVSYEGDSDEYRTLKHPSLIPNTRGAILRFAENNGQGRLNTSILLDPDGRPSNHDYSLKAGESFAIGGATITVGSVSANELTFQVRYN